MAGDVVEHKRNVNEQFEELEERTQKKWEGIRQALHVLGTALNLSEPLLRSLQPGAASSAGA